MIPNQGTHNWTIDSMKPIGSILKDLPPSLRGAVATKQSISGRTRLWIASLTGRRHAPNRWLAMTVENIDMIRASKSLS
jgi:hypothetical protein